MLQLCFPGDGIDDILEVLVIHKAVNVVASCVRSRAAFLVLRHTAAEVGRKPDVEIPRAVSKDVDPEIVFPRHAARISGTGVPAKGKADSLREWKRKSVRQQWLR